jgi:hypothetical protein
MTEFVKIDAVVPEKQIFVVEPWRAGLRGGSYFAVNPATWESLDGAARAKLEKGPAFLEMEGWMKSMLCPPGETL